MLRLLLLSTFCTSFLLWQDESSLKKAYLASVLRTTAWLKLTTEEEIASCKTQIATLSKQRNKTNNDKIAELKGKIVELELLCKKAIDTPSSMIDGRDATDGAVGFIGDGLKGFPVLVQQVTGTDSALVRTGGNLYILEADMNGVIDDTLFDVPRPVEVKGTRTYTTVTGGSKTVRVLRMLTKKEYEEVVAYVKENRPKPTKNLRIWKDVQGKELAKAEFKSRNKDKVVVVTEDDKELELLFNKLNREDRLWLKDK